MERKVYVVEDDVFLGKILVGSINNHNIHAELYTNGRDALKALQNSLPDLLVLDIFMPEMSGFEVLEAIRKDPKLEKLPVLVVTNTDQKADRDRVTSLGADFLVKALMSPNEIVDIIKDRVEAKVV